MTVADLQALVGTRHVRTALEPVGRASGRQYARALGDANPLFSDDTFASNTRHGGVLLPPTLIFDTFQIFDGFLDEQGRFAGRWPDMVEPAVRAGNRYEWNRPPRPEDVLTATATFTGVEERSGRNGRLVFLAFEVRYTAADGSWIGTNYESLLWQPDGTPGGAAATTEPQEHAFEEPAAYASAPPAGVTRRFEDVAADTQIPPLARTLAIANMALYAAATWDAIRIHYDADYARTWGFPAPIVDGQMLGGYLAALMLAWAGPDAELRTLAFRNRAPVFAGDRIEVDGAVVERTPSGGGGLVRCSLSMRKNGAVSVLPDASATLWLPAGVP